MKRSILRNSLMSLYRDSDEIIEALQLVDFTQLDYDFYKAVFSHIDEHEFWAVDDYLNGEQVKRYHHAVDQAAMAVTQDLANLIELAILEKNVKH